MTEVTWVQLYIGKDKGGDVFKIRVGANQDIDDLKKAVHQAKGKSLGHCNAADLVVYEAGTELPRKEEVKLRPSSIVPKNTTDENPLRVLAPAVKLNQQQQRQISLAHFRELLKRAHVTATEQVMGVVSRHFASSAAIVDTPELASDLYYEAALLPRSATKIILKKQGIAVADLFRGSDPSKAVLLHAHENGIPRILKVGTEESILHEYCVWSAVEAIANEQHLRHHHLVPLTKVHFDSATIEIGDVFGGSSTHPPPIRCGLLMKHYQGTLSQCNIPLTEPVLLRFGQCLRTAVSTLHQVGYCHLDIKPSNIFLFETACYLGDYGAAVKTGDPIHERTIKYYPKDGDFDAKEETDMYLLAVTLLELFGSIPNAWQRQDSFTKQEIHELIATVESELVRDFLSSLFIGPK
jgi:serine/threonine protein kinase